MKILLTNDDGIYAYGITALINTLSPEHDLYIVAPEQERSGTGHSITVFEPIKVNKVDLPSVKAAWMISGTPADCVKLALGALIEDDIDYVISGINHGPNLGTDVFYSGTVSAAAEAVLLGYPALAVSMNSYTLVEESFNLAARFIRNTVSSVIAQGLNDFKTLLNINVPVIKSKAEYKGVKITSLGIRNYKNAFEARIDPRGNTYYWLGGNLHDDDQALDSDVIALDSGFITVTPIKLDLTDYELMMQYKKTFSDFIVT